MVKIFGCLFLVVTSLAQFGCALPRALWLNSRVPEELPVITDGTRVSVDVDATAISPGGATTITSPLPVQETKDWYDSTYLSRGWKFYAAHTDMEGNSGTTYQRDIGFYFGDKFIETGHESVSVDVLPQPNGGGSRVNLSMYGNYAWDTPSQLPYGLFLWTLGETEAYVSMAKLLFWL